MELTPIETDFARLREREFSRLDALGHVYLDYTGSGLYPESIVRAHAESLCSQVLGNPHSRNPTSQSATRMVEGVRARVLEHFDADPDEYDVVFTSNATGALKLVGESFPFQPGSRFTLTADNHNSVHGIREYAAARGAAVRYLPLDGELRVGELESHLAGADRGAPNLFAFPAQSNFSGVKHPLSWVERAHEHGYAVFLDAAAFAPANRLSLREVRPDYACVSFYKMFGYPTGVGALLIRHAALRGLRRPWFGGGTVRFVSAQVGVQLPHVTGRGFEDGTLNFLDLAAVPIGLDFLERLGMDRLQAHVMRLTRRLIEALTGLRHGNGAPLVRLYGPAGLEGRGATVALNLLDARGALIDFRVVEQRANEAGVSIRTGYFCNPGAAEHAFQHRADEVRRCADTFSPESWDLQRFCDCLRDRPVGAVRVSFGMASNEADLQRFVAVCSGFLQEAVVPA